MLTWAPGLLTWPHEKRERAENFGRNFKVTQLGFEDGIDLMVLLYKSLGPALGVNYSSFFDGEAGLKNLVADAHEILDCFETLAKLEQKK